MLDLLILLPSVVGGRDLQGNLSEPRSVEPTTVSQSGSVGEVVRSVSESDRTWVCPWACATYPSLSHLRDPVFGYGTAHDFRS